MEAMNTRPGKKKKIETPDLTISRSNWLSQRSCDLREILDMCTSLHSTTTRQRTVYSYNAFEAWYKKNGRVDTCLFTRTNMYISLVSRRKQEKQNNDPVASLLSKQTSVISLSLPLSLPTILFFFFRKPRPDNMVVSAGYNERFCDLREILDICTVLHSTTNETAHSVYCYTAYITS